MTLRSSLPVLVCVVHFACAPEGSADHAVLDGTYGFEVGAAVALICPPDPQGQFMKLYVEGTTSVEGCDMDHPRAIPTTCEDRRAYMDAVPDVCNGMASVSGPNLPMMDYLLAEEGSGWVDLDYVPLIACENGEETSVGLFGNTAVEVVDDATLRLTFDLTDEEGTEDLLSGSVEVPLCP